MGSNCNQLKTSHSFYCKITTRRNNGYQEQRNWNNQRRGKYTIFEKKNHHNNTVNILFLGKIHYINTIVILLFSKEKRRNMVCWDSWANEWHRRKQFKDSDASPQLGIICTEHWNRRTNYRRKQVQLVFYCWLCWFVLSVCCFFIWAMFIFFVVC